MSVLSPWVLYSLMNGGGGTGSPFGGAAGSPFGSLSGQTITAPSSPPPGPPNSSALVGAPSQLATAVSPMPVSSGVPAPTPAPAPVAGPAAPAPVPNSGWVPMPGGMFSWTGQGYPQNDPFGKGFPQSAWPIQGQYTTSPGGQFTWSTQSGLTYGPGSTVGAMGSPLGGMGGGGGGLGASAPAPGSGGIGPTGTGLDPSGGNPGAIQSGTAF